MKSVQLYSDMAYAIRPSVLLGVLPIGCIFIMNGSLSVANFIIVIILALGIMQPLYTVISYTDDIAQIGNITSDIAEVLNELEQVRPPHLWDLPVRENLQLQS